MAFFRTVFHYFAITAHNYSNVFAIFRKALKQNNNKLLLENKISLFKIIIYQNKNVRFYKNKLFEL